MKTLFILGAVVAVAAVGSAHADDIPKFKSGLWESHATSSFGGKSTNIAMKLCHSDESQKKDQDFAAQLRAKDKCTGSVTQTAPGVYVSEYKCTGGSGGPTTSKSTVTFQGSDAYHMEVHITTAARESVMVTDSKYLGACPPDMKPGEPVMEK